MSETQVNVVMVGRNLWEMTKNALEGLIFTMNRPWELYFINNGSTDETKEAFNEVAATWKWQYFNGFKAHHYKRPVGLSAAWNRAWKMCSMDASYTMFVNNDMVFHRFGWWDKIQESLDGGLALTGIQEMSWYRFRFIEGSLLAAPTQAFNELEIKVWHLFDTRFKLSCEDVDLSRRFLDAGLKIGQTHDLQPEWLVHIGHQTLQEFGPTEDLVSKMNASRRALCKKYGYPEQVVD